MEVQDGGVLKGVSCQEQQCDLFMAQIWTLCIGSSLVFGPILGKTWRLYRVFTQRVPDKRVIIRDIQLMGLVALLILADILVLAIWSLTDPVQCAKSISAVVKVVERDVSYSLSQIDSCSSVNSDVWSILLSVLKGSLLLYGTYLAGLTSNVSSPPVNQSPTIMAAVCLVTLSVAVTIPVSKLLHAWPNVVYSVLSGAIFICTLAIDCLLFVPQLTQWKQFEDELNPNPSQMAKYFSSPSKSMRSMYSEDEIYYLLGENNSMKRLLTEKNAMIDSLQEQVNNAKDKLLRLMSASSPKQDREMDSSITNLNSSSTQVTDLPPESPGPLLEIGADPPCTSPTPPAAKEITQVTNSAEKRVEFVVDNTSLSCDTEETQTQLRLNQSPSVSSETEDTVGKDLPQASAGTVVGNDNTPSSAPQSPPTSCGPDLARSSNALGEQTTVVAAVSSKPGFVSSEQLQEILQDLCLDAVSTSLRLPTQTRRASSPTHDKPLPRSSGSPVHYLYPSISPYVMRKRRPPFRTSRARAPMYCYPGSAPPTRRRSIIPCQVDRHTGAGDPAAEPESTETQLLHSDMLKGSNQEDGVEDSCIVNVSPRWGRHSSKGDHQGPPRRCTISPFSGSLPKQTKNEGSQNHQEDVGEDPYDYSDSDSSSSEDNYCYYHRPYCSACFHGPYESTESTVSETSDSELGSLSGYCRKTHPVVNFNEDLKPTFV
ncbi:hypothetical protein JZ751_029092 [Albula glossodonta]|uniref:G-protein coupled receptors family 3 profile domain-containing protein n=1 Tax=Albula glossodonta TaxID=121402 RepID=A0A8T2P8A7_9TELE|nr:hypothetical protein JZ751_029092 [Albula glossodonta]